MTAVDAMKNLMPNARISRAMDIPRSTVYYRKIKPSARRARVPESIESEIIRHSCKRTTYGYRRIWAMIRNSGMHVNAKTARRIMKGDNLSLLCAKQRSHAGSRNTERPDGINRMLETDIRYIYAAKNRFVYLMSIKYCFSKKWIS